MPLEALGAVVEAPGAAPHVEPIVVDPPGPGEVLVRILASGVCHSDAWAVEHGNWGSPFPMLLGHEGAGLIEEVGAGVTSHAPGDPVVLVWAAPCGARGSPPSSPPVGGQGSPTIHQGVQYA